MVAVDLELLAGVVRGLGVRRRGELDEAEGRSLAHAALGDHGARGLGEELLQLGLVDAGAGNEAGDEEAGGVERHLGGGVGLGTLAPGLGLGADVVDEEPAAVELLEGERVLGRLGLGLRLELDEAVVDGGVPPAPADHAHVLDVRVDGLDLLVGLGQLLRLEGDVEGAQVPLALALELVVGQLAGGDGHARGLVLALDALGHGAVAHALAAVLAVLLFLHSTAAH